MSVKSTLWNLLQEQTVVIPKIQRDYAQGRQGKEHIRSAFLGEIKKHLLDGTELTLDFVYGNEEDGKFLPLDGQQRLTTLWLIHWYLAFRLKKLPKVGKYLKKFTYQTRDSSRDFCEQMCSEMEQVAPSDNFSVVKQIQQQSWFFAAWMQDPTVNAMLRTLGGGQGSTTDDHIEALFRDMEDAALQMCWENLTQKITFQLMIIGTEEMPISDDLYIKMNARGKKLTNFENLKADWIASIGDQAHLQKYAEKIDRQWSDFFWNSRIKAHDFNPEFFDGNIDSIFFSFLNRFVLNQHCLSDAPASDYNSKKTPATDGDKQKLQDTFDALYGTGLGTKKSPNNDSLVEYKGFAPYAQYLQDNLEVLDKIFSHLDVDRIGELTFSGLSEDEDEETFSHQELSYHFLPQYSDKQGLSATKLKERVYFHAMCLFLEEPDWNRLNEWKRIVWNLVENGGIENIETMILCLREIDGLGKQLRKKHWNVYAHLSDYEPRSSTGRLADQWNEELEKARQIHADKTKLEKILEAEKHAFFKGTIRFLYSGPDGKPDWDHFEAKYDRARELFPKDSKSVSPETIKQFLIRFQNFSQLGEASYFFTTLGYHARKRCWKRNILCNPALQCQVDAFLMDEKITIDDDYRAFLDSEAVDYICEWPCNYNYRYHYSKGYGIHRDYHSEEGIYTSKQRLEKNRILLELAKDNEIEFFTKTDLVNGFLWGKRIRFRYRGKDYRWISEEEGDRIHPENQPDNKKTWDRPNKDDLLKLLQTML